MDNDRDIDNDIERKDYIMAHRSPKEKKSKDVLENNQLMHFPELKETFRNQ